MFGKRLLFRAMYRVGFTPWDGHPLAKGLRDLVEGNGTAPLPASTALDLGCGTGDNAIYLAQHGWQVTGVDCAPRALEAARAKVAASDVSATFVHGDVTALGSAGVSRQFDLVVDNGCLHGMSDRDRAAYVPEITQAATPGAHLFILAFAPGALFGVRGIDQAEIQRLFSPDWTLVSAGDELGYGATNGDRHVRHYLLERHE